MRRGTSYENTDGKTNSKLSSTEVRGSDRVRNGNQVIGVSVTLKGIQGVTEMWDAYRTTLEWTTLELQVHQDLGE